MPNTSQDSESDETQKSEFEQAPMGGGPDENQSFDILRKMFREYWNDFSVAERKKCIDDFAFIWNKQYRRGDEDARRLTIPASLDDNDLTTLFKSLLAHFSSSTFDERPRDNRSHVISEMVRLHQYLSMYHLREGRHDLTAHNDVLNEIGNKMRLPQLVAYMRRRWRELTPCEKKALLDQMQKVADLTRDSEEEREHEDSTYQRIAALMDPLADFQTLTDALLSPSRSRLSPQQRAHDVQELLAFHQYFQTKHLRYSL